MGILSGFRYRQIIKKLKALGFEFFRHARGVMKSGINHRQGDLRQFQIIRATCPKVLIRR